VVIGGTTVGHSEAKQPGHRRVIDSKNASTIGATVQRLGRSGGHDTSAVSGVNCGFVTQIVDFRTFSEARAPSGRLRWAVGARTPTMRAGVIAGDNRRFQRPMVVTTGYPFTTI